MTSSSSTSRLLYQLSAALVVTLFALVPALLLAFPSSVDAATTSTYTRLFYYQNGVKANQSFLIHASSVNIFAPQTYKLDETGALTGSINPGILQFAIEHKIKVMPLVTNGNFSKRTAETLLDDSAKQDTAIAALVDEAKKNGYSGWQIDFEQIDASYKDKFSAFVAKTYAALKQNNLILSVAVIAKISDNADDYPNNLWQPLIGVFDYSALAANADFISIMSYDDPFSEGPVAEYSWLQKVIAYSLAHIPKEKISLGIPFYYWKWNSTTGERLSIGGGDSLQKIMKEFKTTYHYSTKEQAPYLTYKDHGKSIILWYENKKSISQKVSLIKQNKLLGFSAWALGLEVEEVFKGI